MRSPAGDCTGIVGPKPKEVGKLGKKPDRCKVTRNSEAGEGYTERTSNARLITYQRRNGRHPHSPALRLKVAQMARRTAVT